MNKSKLFIALSVTGISIFAVTPVTATDSIINFTLRENLAALFPIIEGRDDGKNPGHGQNPPTDRKKSISGKSYRSSNNDNFQNKTISMINNSYQGRRDCDPRYDSRCR